MSAARAVGWVRHRLWQALAVLMVTLLLSSCGWRGIANVAIPGGPGTGPGSYTIYVQMPETLALNNNSRVLVADVFVGSVRAIKLKNWVATLTLSLDKGIKLPKTRPRRLGRPACWALSMWSWHHRPTRRQNCSRTATPFP